MTGWHAPAYYCCSHSRHVPLFLQKMLSTVLLVVVAVCSSTVLAVMQNITVKGAVMCDKMLMPNAHIELYEKDLCE